LRAFFVEKMAHYRGVQASPKEARITSGSNPGIDLFNKVLLEPSDTVIMKRFPLSGRGCGPRLTAGGSARAGRKAYCSAFHHWS
jgi:hypothetical protein